MLLDESREDLRLYTKVGGSEFVKSGLEVVERSGVGGIQKKRCCPQRADVASDRRVPTVRFVDEQNIRVEFPGHADRCPLASWRLKARQPLPEG